MARMNGGQALVKSLENEGVAVVFGLPGAGQYEAVDALYQHPTLRYFTTRHEQAATYMADGYARAGGEIAAALVVPGPGVFNAFAGMATAYAVSSPMLVVTGVREGDGPQNGDLHLGGQGPVAHWVARASHPGEIPQRVQAAFAEMRQRRARPILLEIPAAVFAQVGEVQLLAPQSVERPAAALPRVQQAGRLLLRAQKPAIWAGGGVHSAGAGPVLQALAERLQAPVVTTPQGKGALSDRHPLSLGLAELRYAPLRTWLAGRDLLLAVGTRSDCAGLLAHGQVIRIDLDETQLAQQDDAFALAGDALHILQALYEIVSAADKPRPSASAEVHNLNRQRFDPPRQLQPQWDLMQAIRAAIPDDGILVQDMNQMGYYSRNYYPVYQPRTYLTASQLGTLGAAFPLALGAKVAQPGRAVVALCGDGGFLYNAQELATAVQYGIAVVVIVFNDNAYGNVLRAQLEQFDGRVLGTQLHNPDFVRLAEAYGAQGVRVHNAAMLEKALRQALQTAGPTVIEVPVGPLQREF